MQYSIRRAGVGKYTVHYRCPCNVELESPHVDIGTQQQCPSCHKFIAVPGMSHWDEIENRIAREISEQLQLQDNRRREFAVRKQEFAGAIRKVISACRNGVQCLLQGTKRTIVANKIVVVVAAVLAPPLLALTALLVLVVPHVGRLRGQNSSGEMGGQHSSSETGAVDRFADRVATAVADGAAEAVREIAARDKSSDTKAELETELEPELLPQSEPQRIAGQPWKIGKLTWRISRAERLYKFKGFFEEVKPQPQCVFILVHVSVRNDDNEPRMIPSVKMVDAFGRTFETSSKAWQLKDENAPGLESINPGVWRHYKVIFEAPEHTDANLLIVSGGYQTGIVAEIQCN